MPGRVARRIARELTVGRVLPAPLAWIARAIAVLVVIWGFAVCVTITAAVLAALFDL